MTIVNAQNRPKVLIVDDEPAVLAGLRRQLRNNYEVVTATDGQTGLELLAREGPFAVVLSDMRMPVMDGATFLAHARGTAHDTARILLTGQTDIDMAIAAVNHGQIFRFLTKPCPIETLEQNLHEAVELFQHNQARDALVEQALLAAPPSPDLAHVGEELDQALARQQFTLVYQPVVDLRSGRTVGAEALIRWHHPERGGVPPSMFIPTAETTGHAPAIGRWALDQACRDAARWPEPIPGRPLTVAVNLSAHQLTHSDLLHDVHHALARNGLPAHRLILELTETALLTDPENAAHTLRHLRDLGVKIAIDDFGTGYSSLSYLHRLPVDILKLDRTFISPMPASPSLAIAEAIIGLGHTLQLDIVAEGIENGAQWDTCHDLGCHHGQGYLFAKPMNNSDFHDFLRPHSTQR